MTRNYQNHRVFLTDGERRELDGLLRRAARALPAPEGGRLVELFQRHAGDHQHLQSSVGSLRRECTRLRQLHLDAEADLENAVVEHRTAEARIAAVRRLHQPDMAGGHCDECRDADSNPVPWPCPTLVAMDHVLVVQ